MNIRQNLIAFVTCSLVLCSANLWAAQEAFDILEYLDSRQALMVQVENPDEVKECISDLEFFQHELFIEIRDYLSSQQFNELTRKGEIDVRFDVNAESSKSAFANLFDGPLTLAVNSKRVNGKLQWIVAFPTCFDSVHEVLGGFCDLVGCDKAVLKGSLGTRSTGFRDVEIHILESANIALFMIESNLFICSHESKAKSVVSRILGDVRPKRSFANSRKFLLGLKRTHSVASYESLMRIYFDPSIAHSLFPEVPREVWQLSGLNEVVGSVVEVGFPDRLGTSNKVAQVSVDAWIAFSKPRFGVLDGIISSPPLRDAPIVDVEMVQVSEFQAVSVAAEKLFRSLRATVEKKLGRGTFDKMLQQLESSERVKQGFCEQLVSSSNGTFYKYEFAPVDGKNLPPRAFFGIEDREDALKVVQELVQKEARFVKASPNRKIVDEVDCWVWSEAAIQKYRKSFLQITMPFSQNENEAAMLLEPTAYSVGEKFVAVSSSASILQTGNVEVCDLNQLTLIEELLQCVARHDSALESPFLVWAMWPQYWKPLVDTWRFQQRNTGIVSTREDVEALFKHEDRLEDAKTLEELREKILMRIVQISTESFGNVIIVGACEDFGVRVSAISFADKN